MTYAVLRLYISKNISCSFQGRPCDLHRQYIQFAAFIKEFRSISFREYLIYDFSSAYLLNGQTKIQIDRLPTFMNQYCNVVFLHGSLLITYIVYIQKVPMTNTPDKTHLTRYSMSD